jgi:BirA family transcriptional regulator, biotin operon repressor / biotin---[acetyl-CoA-carboxylase] ligase
LDADVLRAALGPRWGRVDVVAETGSTNADLLARHEAPDRSVLVAEVQSAGRGRLDRTWTSAPGAGLTFSVLLRPGAPIPTWGWLPLLTGVALHSAVTEFAGVDAALKWPNDLLAGPDRRKAAGVLAQTSGDAVVIGIGLNVSTTADELPVETATSLALSGASDVGRSGLLVAILTALDARVAQWEDVGGDAEACGLAAAYRAACSTIGQQVSVSATDGRAITGTARSIDSDGRLIVTTDAGDQVVGAGDVQHLRPVT